MARLAPTATFLALLAVSILSMRVAVAAPADAAGGRNATEAVNENSHSLIGGLASPESGWSSGPNLLINPIFDQGMSGWAAPPDCFALDPAIHPEGIGKSLKMQLDGCARYPAADNSYRVKSGLYSIAGQIKTSRLSYKAGRNCGARISLVGDNSSPALLNDHDWTKVEEHHVTAIDSGDHPPRFRVESFCGKGSGTAWFADLALRAEEPPPLQVFLRYPNYRGLMFSDGPSDATVNIQVNPPDGRNLAQLRVEMVLLDANQKRVAVERFAAKSEFEASVAMNDLPTGKYQLQASLLGPAGQVLFTQSPYVLVKADPAVRTRMKAWVDPQNHAHFGDGRPHFVVGLYDTSGFSSDEQAYEQRLSDIAQAPVDLIINYLVTNAKVPEIDAYARAMRRHGIYFLATVNNFYKAGPWYPDRLAESLDAQTQEQLISRYAGALAGDPDVIGYYVQDEPPLDVQPATFKQYQLIKDADPSSITYAVLIHPADFSFWRDSVDVLGADPYPLQQLSGNNLAQVADYTRALVSVTKGARPVWTVIQFFQSNSHSAWPTERELHDMSWMAIAEGAQGLLYWSYGQHGISWVRDSARRASLWRELVDVTREIKRLEPVLLERDAAVLRSPPSPPAIIVREKVGPDGGRYAIAYNHGATPVDATFTLRGSAKNVLVHDENRTAQTSSGGMSFSDHFEPYQAHVYEIH